MSVYYTIGEGGNLMQLKVKSSHQKIAKHLFRNRRVRGWDKSELIKVLGKEFSLIPCSNNGRQKVHSVFFFKGNRLVKVWDAHLNGYRPKKSIRKSVIPPTSVPLMIL